MSLIIDALVNLWRLIRNAHARLLGRPPEYMWIEVSGPLAEFETPVGFLRRRLSQGPSPPTLERLRLWLDRIVADGRPRVAGDSVVGVCGGGGGARPTLRSLVWVAESDPDVAALYVLFVDVF